VASEQATTQLGAYKKTWLTRQFGHPTGLLGRIMGHLMALEHRKLNRVAVDLLDVQPDDRVLEIGYGPGTAIAMLAERATDGLVAGVDISEVMLKQATTRNHPAIEAGRVDLRQGSVSSLPFDDSRFTRVCTINCFHDWPNQAQDLREVHRVMAGGGLLLLWLPMKPPGGKKMTPGHTDDEVRQIQAMLTDAGFGDLRTHTPEFGRPVTCVLANR